MSRKLLPTTLTAALLGSTAMADVPSVAVDIAPLHSLVARVMDGVGTPDLVIPPGASPHEYSLRPSEAQALQDADLVFWVGEDLTPWLEEGIETLAEGATVTALLEADDTILLDFREGATFEAHDHADHGDEDHDDHDHEEHAEKEHDDHDHEEHAEKEHDDHDHEEHAEEEHDDHDHEEHAEEEHDDHDHEEQAEEEHDDHDHEEHAEEAHGHEGHDHGEHDPHAWLSPDNAATWLNVIAAQLSAADPDNAGTYFANAAAGRDEIAALKVEVAGILDPVRGGKFIVFHDAYQYFETTFDFSASGAISISDASDPSPARIAEIQETVRDNGISCVLSEPQYNPAMVATVMDGTGASTGVLDPLGSNLDPGAALYPTLITGLASELATCLK